MKFCLSIIFLCLIKFGFALTAETENLIEKGKKFFLHGDHDMSLHYFNLATSNSYKNVNEISETYYLIGKFYTDNGIHDLALKYFFSALDESILMSDNHRTQEIYNSIGGSYYDRMHYLEAKKYWEKSSEINRAISNDDGLSSNLNNLGEIEYLAGNYEKAMHMYKQSSILKEALGDSSGLGIVLLNLANSCFFVDKLDTGFIYIERTEAIADYLKSDVLKQYVYQTYGNFYQKIGDLSLSSIWYHKSLSIKLTNPSSMDATKKSVYTGLQENHRQLGNLDSSLYYQSMLNELAIDIIEKEKRDLQTSAEIKSSIIKKDNEISSLKEKSRFRRNVYYVVIGVLIVIILFGFIINRQRNKVITQKNITIEKEKELLALKSRFIATASHQFRTPLTVIQSSLGLIALQRDKMNKELQVNFDKSHERIKNHIELMTTLMDEVLVSETIASENVEFEKLPIDLTELCKDAVNTYNEIQTDGRRIEYIELGEPSLTSLNEMIMKQAVSNLVSNAFKYSEGRTPPKLTLEYSKKMVTISVKDYGIGIPQKDLKHLFEPFFRASNVGDHLGTGLGLAITKEYISLMGGTFSVRSEINKGSEFIVALPTKS